MICPSCHSEFTGARGARYCSITCSVKAHGLDIAPTVRVDRHATSPTARGYDHAWRLLARETRRQAGYQCQMPTNEKGDYDEQGQYVCGDYADTADHVIEFTDITDPLRLDPTNTRASCKRHNSQKAAANTNRKRRDNNGYPLRPR